MIVHNNIYPRIITLESLFGAWEEFAKGKRKKRDVIIFERFLEDNLFALYKELGGKTYKHGSYKSFYVRDPKVRHIHKAFVRDRVVHHLMSNVLEEVFEPVFFSHSYSCRRNKGTHKAVKAFVKLSRKASKNNTSRLFVLKCDIKKFFASVDHQILLQILSKSINDKDFMWLLKEIIESFAKETNKPFSMPIGNLTSQLFANIYMNPLDQFIKHELKVKYYIRYADDFVILSADKNYLESLIGKIGKFLSFDLKLTFHPKKIMILNYYLGIDFLGYVIFPNFILPRTKTKKRMLRKMSKKIDLYRNHMLPSDSLNQSLQSYLGYLSHANAFQVSQHLKTAIFSIYLTN